jgi:hypothetical protein
MNTVRIMKNIAWPQLVIAIISALFFIPLSLVFCLYFYPVLPTIGAWWIGIRLIVGYYNISEGKHSILETRRFWFGSLIFNAIGVVIGFLILKNNSSLSPGYVIGSLPSLVGSILAILALLVPAESTKTLESQYHA